MQIAGEYIVVGADDQGTPVRPGVLPDHEKMFDDANLRPKLAKWLPEPFELRTAVHRIDDCTFAIIYIVPCKDGFCIFSDDGKYHERRSERILFRKGEVFARHGTVNERWRQPNIERIREHLVAREREQWRAELREELVQLGIARQAQQPGDRAPRELHLATGLANVRLRGSGAVAPQRRYPDPAAAQRVASDPRVASVYDTGRARRAGAEAPRPSRRVHLAWRASSSPDSSVALGSPTAPSSAWSFSARRSHQRWHCAACSSSASVAS